MQRVGLAHSSTTAFVQCAQNGVKTTQPQVCCVFAHE